MARIAILGAPLFEDIELLYPYYRLKEAGHEVHVLGFSEAPVEGKHGLSVTPEKVVDRVDPADYDAVVVPGGFGPDYMRRDGRPITFLKAFADGKRPVAAICHAGWALISAGLVKGRTLTSFPSLRDDLVNAGAEWVDKEVVVDGPLVTSRNPNDLPVFMRTFLEKLG